MATNRKVIVLTPNGRRQNVAVTPNTTILQILEEVCQKHGYNIDDYDLKHFNNVLDPNAILRFTGLANNAQLEMVTCKKTRHVSTVVIGIQLENGQRLMGEFVPNMSLVEVLQNVNFREDLERITLTYMHREISGTEALKNTTLKSLGLNNGKAVLRVLHKNPEPTHVVASTESKALKNNADPNKNCLKNSNKTLDSATLFEKESMELDEDLEVYSENTKKQTGIRIKKEETDKIVPSTSKDNDNRGQILSPKCINDETSDLNIDFIGDRNGLIFNLAAIQGTSRDELPDDFYDLTVNDAKVLLRDAIRLREELEEAPLLTNVQRQLNQEKETLNQIHKYRLTIIRIHFPDQFVLQGLFRPVETVQAIKDFIKGYLIDANSDFAIFTAPPKHTLNPNAHLMNENLVPCAIVYYSGPSELKPDIKEKVTDPKKVAMQVTKVRISMIREENQKLHENVKLNGTSNKAHTQTSNASSSTQKESKIPKWFKPIV